MLIKQVGVYVNILNCKLKKHLAEVFKKNGVNLTAEQYLVMDTLWNEGTLTQQAIAFILQKDKNSVTVSQSCLTLCNTSDYSSPGSTVHGIFQERMLEYVTISFSRGSSHSGD